MLGYARGESNGDVGRPAREIEDAARLEAGECFREAGDRRLVRLREARVGVGLGLVVVDHQLGLGDPLHHGASIS